MTSSDPAAGGDAAGTRPSLAGNWTLIGLTTVGEAVAMPAEAALEMTIDAGSIGGNAGCNQFGGTIDAADDGSLQLGPMAATAMACEPRALMDFEQVYLGALAETTTWEVTPEGLIFRGEGVELAYAVAAPNPTLALEGTTWTFDTVFSGEGVNRAATSARMDQPEATLVIADGTATLTSDDCGTVSFALNYEPGVDGTVNVPEPGSIVAECSEPESNLRTALDGITSASGFMVHETRLTFIGLPGETVSFSGS